MYSLGVLEKIAKSSSIQCPLTRIGPKKCSRGARKTGYPSPVQSSRFATSPGQELGRQIGNNQCQLTTSLPLNLGLMHEYRMMYSALNIRPYLQANERLNNSYWFLAISY